MGTARMLSDARTTRCRQEFEVAARPRENGNVQLGARIDRDAPSFIETQFPVSKLSKESYKEREAKNSQTLTPLGKWWGRKPLIMVRAVILGLLLPSSRDPRKDLEVFLQLLTMDAEGLWRRKNKSIPLREVYRRLAHQERSDWFEPETEPDRPKLKKGTPAAARQRLQRRVFDGMGYDEKLRWCLRPEQIDGPSMEVWESINDHLGTSARSLPELVQELGQRRFGRIPRVGDAFCGGGSVPFEAARLGCRAFGSDLNPVASLLTWGALNIVGGNAAVAERLRKAQADVFDALDRQVTAWGIEHNDVGWRADAFLYCTETICPECYWRVPLAPSWVVAEKTRTVARLVADAAERAFAIVVESGVSPDAIAAARKAGTVEKTRLKCPNGCDTTTIAAIRGDDGREKGGRGRGLRRWENDDLVPRKDDVFQERLYCVRWRPPRLADLLWCEQRTRTESKATRDRNNAHRLDSASLDAAIEALAELLCAEDRGRLADLRQRDWCDEDRALEDALPGTKQATRLHKAISARDRQIRQLSNLVPKVVYRAIDSADLEREARALGLLRERFPEWQRLGYIPNRRIVPGAKTDEPIETRGWTHWHHLFTPQQLLTLGMLASSIEQHPLESDTRAAMALGLSRCVDYNSKLCRWHTRTIGDKSEQTFSNQAFNTLLSFAGRGVQALRSTFVLDMRMSDTAGVGCVSAHDARRVTADQDIWLTDPPYADAVNYHELSEYLLAWHAEHLTKLFPSLYTDSKRALAVRGSGSEFRQSMVDCYSNLADRMPNDGFQVVMFTHQDAAVWADLTLILWAAGLRVTAAWTVATETESALKDGNYVQGTVLMVLRKQASEATAFLDELVPEVQGEVERQLDTMLALDDIEEPNFADADYQLAAYAAALRVLTQYSSIEDIDVARQLAREVGADANPIETIIEDAVRTASNVRVPAGLGDARSLWLRLGAEERLYLKGLEVESHRDYRAGVYQEFARGFGVRDYRALLHTGKANETRLKTATELGRSDLRSSTFGTSLVRHALYATWRAAETEDVTESLTWLRAELPDYWNSRDALTTVLRYLAATDIDHWREDAAAARLVAGAVENDHV